MIKTYSFLQKKTCVGPSPRRSSLLIHFKQRQRRYVGYQQRQYNHKKIRKQMLHNGFD